MSSKVTPQVAKNMGRSLQSMAALLPVRRYASGGRVSIAICLCLSSRYSVGVLLKRPAGRAGLRHGNFHTSIASSIRPDVSNDYRTPTDTDEW